MWFHFECAAFTTTVSSDLLFFLIGFKLMNSNESTKLLHNSIVEFKKKKNLLTLRTVFYVPHSLFPGGVQKFSHTDHPED